MPEVAFYALVAAAPLFAMVLLVVYHRVRRTFGDLPWGGYVVVQVLLLGLIGYGLHLRAFPHEVSGKVGGGTDYLGSTTTTELFVHVDGGESRKFHFASRVPDGCKRGMALHKPAYSTKWTCSSAETRIVHDADGVSFVLGAAAIGAAFLLWVGRR